MSVFLPEWSPVEAVVVVWPQPHGDWAANYSAVEACYWNMLEAIAEFAPIWLLKHPSVQVENFDARVSAIKGLHEIEVISDIEYDDTWVRDFGPLSTTQGLVSFRFNGWGGKYIGEKDNLVSRSLAKKKHFALKEVDFVCEGGALEVNESKVLLANAQCIVDPMRNASLDRNGVESVLKNTLGVDQVAWLDGVCMTGDDTDGHIDTIARFAPGDKVIYSGRNQKHHDAGVLESLHGQITRLSEKFNWELFELPTPVVVSEVDGRLLPATYANFLLVNGAVVVPIYDCPEDGIALDVVRAAFPDFKVIAVKCAALAEQHGSLHCSTMQIANAAVIRN